MRKEAIYTIELYLGLKQYISVSDNVSWSQPIYFSFNQYNIVDFVTVKYNRNR